MTDPTNDAPVTVEEALRLAVATLQTYADPSGYTDANGEPYESDASVHSGVLAQQTLDRLAALASAPAGDAVERPAGWTYEYDSGAGWETHVVLNTLPNLPTKRAPAKHYGSEDIRNVQPFYYAALGRPRAAVGERRRAQHIETLKWLKSGYLPGGPRDVWGACQAAILALQSPPAKVKE